MKTLITEHWAGQVRGSGRNDGTRIVPVTRAVLDLRTIFERAYSTFADQCRAIDEPGVALVVVDERTGKASGMAHLRALVDRYVTSIVGRHDVCDLYVDGNTRLALRQLAVILDPVRDWKKGTSDVGFRILDLRTTEGMTDEEGRALRGLRSEGPAMVRCGGYAVFALPLGNPLDWPESASEAWDCMPERVYHDELLRVPDASIVREIAPPPTGHTKIVMRTAGPRDAASQLVTDRDLVGRLQVRGSRGTATIDIGHQALREGVLIGRYARCDGMMLSNEESISRVHALLLMVEDRLLAIDVASTNGMRQMDCADARLVELIGETELELGFSVFARWTWSS